MTVKSAMRDRPDEALPVIMAELKQMVEKNVWHGVHARHLSKRERKSIIRSSMFLRDKYQASGEFEKFKARIVAGGDQQDKTLYDDLASPTVVTAHVFALAGLAAKEDRLIATVDIGGAYLNADMTASGVKVHMRLDPTMTKILVKIDPTFTEFVRDDGSSIVLLDKALYGCVESAHLWYKTLRKTLENYGLKANPIDPCVFNLCSRESPGSGKLSMALHVDDLLITCDSREELDRFFSYLRSEFKEISVHQERKLSYLGMMFDFSTKGEVKVTMEKCTEDIIRESGVETRRRTPATSELFNTRDNVQLASNRRRV